MAGAASHRVGEEGGGFQAGAEWLGAGQRQARRPRARRRERCLEMATAYAKQRSTFGRLLADRQASNGSSPTSSSSCRRHGSWIYKAATRLDKGRGRARGAYVCKYFADEMRSARRSMHADPGGIGLTTDLPIEKLWRQQRSYRDHRRASEVMRW